MRFILILVLIAAFWSMAPMANSNAYLTANTYQCVHVKSGDTIWDIAARYSSEKEDLRNLTLAIMEVNKLSHNTPIYPGQVLKVPVKSSSN